MNNDMQITLVVFDKKSYKLSEKVMGEIDSYIDAHYVKKQKEREYKPTSSIYEKGFHENEEIERRDNSNNFGMAEALNDAFEFKLSTIANTNYNAVEASFHEKLFDLIAKSGMDNKSVWKDSNLDRKHFSKIQCNPKYHPKKKTVLALCIGLKLDLDQSKDLLARADWAFSPSSKLDLIVQKAIIDKNYNINDVNQILFEYTNETLGV